MAAWAASLGYALNRASTEGVATIGIRCTYGFQIPKEAFFDPGYFEWTLNTVSSFATQRDLLEKAAHAAGICAEDVHFIDINQFRSTEILNLRFRVPSKEVALAFGANLGELFCQEAQRNYLMIPLETEVSGVQVATVIEEQKRAFDIWSYRFLNNLEFTFSR